MKNSAEEKVCSFFIWRCNYTILFILLVSPFFVTRVLASFCAFFLHFLHSCHWKTFSFFSISQASLFSFVIFTFWSSFFFYRLINPKVVRACVVVLADWEKITSRVLKSAVTLLHRIAFDCKCPAMLYQVSFHFYFFFFYMCVCVCVGKTIFSFICDVE